MDGIGQGLWTPPFFGREEHVSLLETALRFFKACIGDFKVIAAKAHATIVYDFIPLKSSFFFR